MTTQAIVVANPGSRGWAAGAAFLGRWAGGVPGLLLNYVMTKDKPVEEQEGNMPALVLRWIGQIAGAAGGAYAAAPPDLRGRAALGAGIGGAIPFVGAPLAALGAYLATKPKGRKSNLGAGATTLLVILGLAAAGGATYAGVKYWKKRKAKENVVLIYPVRELDGLQVDMRVGDAISIETDGEAWTMSTEYPFSPSAAGWAAETSSEYVGTWDVMMFGPGWTSEVPEPEIAFTIKIHENA
jgi:hypothetical protein